MTVTSVNLCIGRVSKVPKSAVSPGKEEGYRRVRRNCVKALRTMRSKEEISDSCLPYQGAPKTCITCHFCDNNLAEHGAKFSRSCSDAIAQTPKSRREDLCWNLHSLAINKVLSARVNI